MPNFWNKVLIFKIERPRPDSTVHGVLLISITNGLWIKIQVQLLGAGIGVIGGWGPQ